MNTAQFRNLRNKVHQARSYGDGGMPLALSLWVLMSHPNHPDLNEAGLAIICAMQMTTNPVKRALVDEIRQAWEVLFAGGNDVQIL